MKSFGIRFFAYLAIVALLCTAAMAVLSNKYRTSRILDIKYGLVPNDGRELSLVLGTSHAYYGFNTQLIDSNCYNLATPCQGLKEDYAILKKILQQANVKYVILPISYHTNSHVLSNAIWEGEALRIFDYERVYGVQYEHNKKYYRYRYLMIGQVAKMLKGNEDPNKMAMDKLGNLMQPCLGGYKGTIGDSSVAFGRHNVNIDFSKRNEYIDSIVALCHTKDIKLNFVAVPFTKGYRNQIAKAGTGFDAFLASLASMESSCISFFDCRELITSNEELYFRDSDHLSACGKDSLSRYLSSRLLK